MGVILGLLGAIFLSLLIRLLGVEIGVWHTPICRWLVRIAAGRLPADERAAVESEWLAVIEDMRSPTAQLLHSLSYAVSAVRIRQAIDPEQARASSAYARGIVFGQASGIATATGLIAGLLYNGGDVANRLQALTSKPITVAVIIIGFSLQIYVCYRFLMWRFKQRGAGASK
ncbi:MAG: hypothetical protein WDN50_02515 [Bradyrhizobium sp.]